MVGYIKVADGFPPQGASNAEGACAIWHNLGDFHTHYISTIMQQAITIHNWVTSNDVSNSIKIPSL